MTNKHLNKREPRFHELRLYEATDLKVNALRPLTKIDTANRRKRNYSLLEDREILKKNKLKVFAWSSNSIILQLARVRPIKIILNAFGHPLVVYIWAKYWVPAINGISPIIFGVNEVADFTKKTVF